MGRCKYLTPIYSALENSGQHDLGVTWYNENLDFYHPVAITTEAQVLGLDSTTETTDSQDFDQLQDFVHEVSENMVNDIVDKRLHHKKPLIFQ